MTRSFWALLICAGALTDGESTVGVTFPVPLDDGSTVDLGVTRLVSPAPVRDSVASPVCARERPPCRSVVWTLDGEVATTLDDSNRKDGVYALPRLPCSQLLTVFTFEPSEWKRRGPVRDVKLTVCGARALLSPEQVRILAEVFSLPPAPARESPPGTLDFEWRAHR